jgi:hypothetical protein
MKIYIATLSFTGNRDSNLEDFVREHDYIMYKNLSVTARVASSNEASLHAMQPLIDIHIVNSFESVHAFHSHLTSLNILDPDRVRPRWDAYFMVCEFHLKYTSRLICLPDAEVGIPSVASLQLYEAACGCHSGTK